MSLPKIAYLREQCQDETFPTLFQPLSFLETKIK